MAATRTIGHLEFGTPETPIIETVQRAIATFTSKYAQYKPSILMVNPLNLPHEAELAALGLEVRFTNAVLASHHAWIGAPKSGQSGPAVRVIASKAVASALMDAPAPVVEQTIVLEVPQLEEGESDTLIIAPWDDQQIRAFIRLSRPALPAPRIAALLCAVNPRDPEVGEQDGEGEEDESALPPMVLNREWIEAWQVVHAHTRADEHAGVSQQRAERNQAMLRSFMSNAVKFTAPLQPLVRPDAPRTDREIRELMDQRSIAVNLPERMRRDRIRAMFERQLCDSSLLEYNPTIYLPSPHVVLPQEVIMHPRDVMRELADQKSQPVVLSAGVPHREPLSIEAHKQRKAERSSEELSEEAVMSRLEVSPQMLDDFMEALQFAVEHHDNEEAGLLIDGHRLDVLDRKGLIILHHPNPALKGTSMKVGVQLRQIDTYRFVAQRHEVRAYLEKSRKVFEAKGIVPLHAGEKYPFEVKAA